MATLIVQSRYPRARAFSMIELVMVVIILGLIAAIAVPRISQAANRAKASALSSSLRTLNSAAELYAVEHEGRTPAHDGSSVSLLGSALQRRLTMRTDLHGDFSAGDRIFGPYLRSMPANPVNGLRTVRVDGAAARSGLYGWRFNSATNTFTPDHSIALQVIPADADLPAALPPGGQAGNDALADAPALSPD